MKTGGANAIKGLVRPVKSSVPAAVLAGVVLHEKSATEVKTVLSRS